MMAKIRFKASIRLEKKGEIVICLPTIIPGDLDEVERKNEYRKVRDFLIKKGEKEKQTGNVYNVWIEMETYFRKATPSQWRLFMMIVNRIADHDCLDYKNIYAGIRREYFPKEHDDITPKVGVDITTKELAQVIELTVADCTSKVDPVNLDDLYVLWQDFRHNIQKSDPFDGTYKNKEDYRERNPNCEICGKGLRTTEAPDGTKQREGQLMHIVPGGEDVSENWMVGCTDCHILQQHQKGWFHVVDMFPQVRGKIEKAFARWGAELKDKAARLDGENSQLLLTEGENEKRESV